MRRAASPESDWYSAATALLPPMLSAEEGPPLLRAWCEGVVHFTISRI